MHTRCLLFDFVKYSVVHLLLRLLRSLTLHTQWLPMAASGLTVSIAFHLVMALSSVDEVEKAPMPMPEATEQMRDMMPLPLASKPQLDAYIFPQIL